MLLAPRCASGPRNQYHPMPHPTLGTTGAMKRARTSPLAIAAMVRQFQLIELLN